MTDRDHFAAFVHQDTEKVWRDFGVRVGEMIAEVMSKRVADAMLRERGVAEPMPKEKRAEVSVDEPVAWAVVYPNGVEAMIAWRKPDAEDMASASDRIVPLYTQPQPTLTDEEREALAEAVGAYNDNDDDEECAKIAATLHGLLKRLG